MDERVERRRRQLRGGSGYDTIYAGAGNDEVFGDGDNDQLDGGAGNDLLDGGNGVDTVAGGSGNDIYLVDNAGDAVTELGGQGADEVRASVSFVLTAGADVETLATANAAGTAAINLTGNATGNAILGNVGNNVINGGAGNDQLTGYAGQDSFLFNTALNAATNVDVITDFNVSNDTIRLDDAIFGALSPGALAEASSSSGQPRRTPTTTSSTTTSPVRCSTTATATAVRPPSSSRRWARVWLSAMQISSSCDRLRELGDLRCSHPANGEVCGPAWFR